jgi:exopolysaccharide biosynthesis protein
MLCEDFDTYWKEAHYDWVYMPRTGIGYDRARQTLIVAVVDGYQLGYSRGVRQIEFANLLREFGAYDAMELDGGGSTTMVLDNTIVNNPSDATGERHVANALLFFWNEDQPEPLYPAGVRQQASDGIRLRAR